MESQSLNPMVHRLVLPAGHWPDLLSFLLSRFRHVSREVWLGRFAEGRVWDSEQRPCHPDMPYRPGLALFYQREEIQETPVPFCEQVLYRDERLLVVDKPHFLACMPAGQHQRETLLYRLQHRLNLPNLSALHRLDRETAGVMLLCIDPRCRDAYQALFRLRQVQKTYHAIARFRPELPFPRHYRSHLQERADSFLMEEVAGEINSETAMAILAHNDQWARYQLQPLTGKKHQLRLHMAQLGIPIRHDRWYPTLRPTVSDDFSQPLQLLAKEIRFIDPYTNEARCFSSQQTLLLPPV
jgi:tRNA pseudouridine32 synthase/23S rRNA pseudouridine746 synthase